MFGLKITQRGHNLLTSYINEGDSVIDATVGNGHDTLFLREQVGATGLVTGFDVQQIALNNTRRQLLDHGFDSNIKDCINGDTTFTVDKCGVFLYLNNHSCLADRSIIQRYEKRPQVIMFNLGYLPSSEKTVKTVAKDTMAGLQGALDLLKSGGVLSVVTYPGHKEGYEENQRIFNWLCILDACKYEVLNINQTNRSDTAPVQYFIYKK